MHLTQKVPVIARSEATWQSSIYIPKCIFTTLVCKNKKKRGKPVHARSLSGLLRRFAPRNDRRIARLLAMTDE